MKESNLFSPRLFREGFRQLKIPGVLMTIFYSLIVVIEPMERISSYYFPSSWWKREPKAVDFHNIFYVLNYTAFLIVPVLIFWLFRFMMKRSTSDFYHSLPVSRVCLTVSFFASALTWMTVILLAQTAVGVLIHALYPAVFVVDYSSIWAGMLGQLTIGLLSGGYTLLALALTGTMMSGMVTAVLLAYVPLLASTILCEGMEDVYHSYHVGEWSPDGRVAFRSFINNFEDALELNLMNAFDDPKHSVWQILVTLLIGIVIFLLAVLVMRFRKSETAGKPAICQGVHVAIRISGTLFVLWFLGNVLFGSISLVAIILALVAYLSYELLTTRRWYNLLKSLVWLPLVAILYFVPYLCGFGIALLF